jgi:hypothetical protein
VRFFYLFTAFLTFTTPNLAQKIFKDKALVSNESTVVQTSSSGENMETRDSYKLLRGDKELQIEFGVSPFNPSNFAGPKEFDVYGRDLYLASFRVGRVVGTKKMSATNIFSEQRRSPFLPKTK